MTYRMIARRDVLKLAASGSLALLSGVGQRVWASNPSKDYPFSLGVASGDPWPDGFVLWTRLAPAPLEPHGGMKMAVVAVDWEIAEDDRFTRVVRSGVAAARPELGHSVHVEAKGLKPGWRYWYRFRANGESSPVGTARTATPVGVGIDRLRIGVAGCQHYEEGWYTAYRHLGEVPDLDAIFHYGDYIYEGRARDCAKVPNCVRSHAGDEIYSLDDYRRRYAQYKLDPDLQFAHAAAPFLVSYDDHEVDNNWYSECDQDGSPAEIFLLRRAAAMQAWYEHMPVRQAQYPTNGGLKMYRRFDYGDLLRVQVLDTRQYRHGGLIQTGRPPKGCRLDSSGPVTMLGTQQEAWLAAGLSSSVRWNLLAQQVMVMPFTYPQSRDAGRTNVDSWSGYAQARERLVAQIAARDLKNVVIATGDVHQHHAGVVPVREGELDGPAAATEFVCTSISSGGNGVELSKAWQDVPADNPHCQLYDARRGYQVFDIGRDSWRTNVWTMDKVSEQGGRATLTTSFVVEHDRVALHRDS
ncbi:alkaline phosphatase D family protein [Steroidobacter cummioxidans]|uniref:alkaline phosphatase D family protein n=1 Tax=Steroidobacter cummioxidans TaxID=1803913 RepID=UPI00137A83DD|nr:alkaline phosphatase D family protein [Steroidobacter cummioxidans]